jgi:hypothetical protein
MTSISIWLGYRQISDRYYQGSFRVVDLSENWDETLIAPGYYRTSDEAIEAAKHQANAYTILLAALGVINPEDAVTEYRTIGHPN